MATKEKYEYHIVFSAGSLQLANVTVFGHKRYPDAVAMDTLNKMPKKIRDNCTHISGCRRRVVE